MCSAFLDDEGTIHTPKPNSRRTGDGADGSGFKVLHKQVCYQGAYWRANVCNMYLFIILTLEQDKVLFRQNSWRVRMLEMDGKVLLLSYGFCCSLPWMMLRAGFTGTNVNRAITS